MRVAGSLNAAISSLNPTQTAFTWSYLFACIAGHLTNKDLVAQEDLNAADLATVQAVD